MALLRKTKDQNKSRLRSSKNSWTVSSLESRLMLAADAGAAIASSAPAEPAAIVAQAQSTQTAQQQATSLVFLDPSVENLQQLTSGIADNAEIILLDSDQNGIDQISQTLATHRGIESVHVISHGSVGQIQLGDQTVNERTLVETQSQIRAWRNSLTADADILLYSCETGNGQVGQSFLSRLASLSGADIAASTDLTGGQQTTGDWDLEATVGQIDSAIVLNQQTRDRYSHTLDISIRAAGVTGEEEMRLLVGGDVVQTWTVGGNASAGQFETYTVDIDGVNADDVRVEFTNDLYDPDSGTDRNLRVDSVTIDGVVYETEAPSVFSTGTWLPDEGITPGFDQSEYLHSNGYFQYAGSNQGEGSQINIAASGDEGGEELSLVIGGETVQTWNVTTSQSVYTYNAQANVSLEDIQIHFTNDQYDPENGIDSNLNVDYIELDGNRHETEAPTVFSTGSWLPEDGVQPGFRQSDTLNSNGYFQYATSPQVGTQIQIAANGSEGGEAMSLVIGGETVQTWNVTTTEAIYTYNASSDVSASDIQIHFTNDQYDPENGIDSNLSVDYIQLDGVRYETEAPSTFSTGTWLPEDGVQSGNRQSETLHTNGYFQFDSQTPVTPGTLLNVGDAQGNQGDTISLDIALNLPEGYNGAVIISNVPSDAVIQSNGKDLDRFEDQVLVAAGDLDGLTITPGSNFAGSILLNVEATVLDSEFNETTETATITVAVASTGNGYSRNGTEGRDIIIANFGNTTIDSLGGNDVLIGLDTDDQLKGGSGNDAIIGGVGADVLIGDDGNDFIDGGAGVDGIQGGGGDDRLYGNGGNDTIDGGDGNDELVGGGGDDTIIGGEGFDIVVLEGTRAEYTVQDLGNGGYSFVGPGGTDTVSEVEVVQFADVTIPIESVNDPNFVGTPLPSIDGATAGDDELNGTLVIGREGNDTITGTQADDILLGGEGDDQINGGDGDDFLQGDAGNDTIDAGDGNDFIVAGTGTGVDSIDGGFGWDIIAFSQATSSVTVDLTRGTAEGGSGTLSLTSVESVIGSDNGDVFRFESIGAGTYYSIDGSSGNDVLELKQFREDQVTVQGNYIQIQFDGGGMAEIDAYNVEFVEVLNASIQTSNGEVFFFEGNDFVAGDNNFNTLYGGDGNDRLLGFGGDDLLFGGSGNDVLFGGQGNDELNGEDGNDELFGEEGDDTLNGNAGDDRITDGIGNNTIDGGDGFDTLVISGNRADYAAEMLPDGRIQISGASGTDTAQGIENFEFNGDGFSVAELLNNNPVAQPDTFSTPADTPMPGSIAANDFDPDGDTIVFQLARPPQNGTILFSQTGEFFYNPNPGFVGTDTFLYAATDVNGGLAVVPVTIVVG